jgi:acyl carrier protein phosphodiesterase
LYSQQTLTAAPHEPNLFAWDPSTYLYGMNFLAHAYLSFDVPDILVGNMTSDFIKGKKKFDYPILIQQGINLHRAIDQFTDTHSATFTAKSIFKADYGLYSGAFMDIVYDHFLANDTKIFADENALKAFANRSYDQIRPFAPFFPSKFQLVYKHMREHDWLYNYKFRQGIRNSFEGLVHRAVYMNNHLSAFASFEAHYEFLGEQYAIFFPELYAFARKTLNSLMPAS